MEIEQGGLVGIIGALAIVLAMTLTPAELDNAYYCSLNDQVGVFHRLSGTAKTGYYYDTDGETELRSACRSGRTYVAWINLRSYAESIGVDPESLLNKEQPPVIIDNLAPAKADYVCTKDGCY